jgi:hypothetical protein
MAEMKTKLTADSPKAFIDKLEDPQKRKDCHELAALMKEVTGKPAKMWGPSIVGFDQYHYKYESGREGDSCLTGFSPRSQALTLYLGSSGLNNKALMSKLGKYKTSKGCLYIKKLDDVDRKVLRELVTASVQELRKQHGTK